MFITNKIFTASMISNIEGSNKSIKKFIELKIRKLFKFQKLSESKNLKSEKSAKFKNLSKSKNLFKFDIKKVEPSFLIPDTKIVFNRLLLIFIKALILGSKISYFNQE